MAQIIALNRLAEVLAARIGVSDAEAQHFIQLYFETISYGLVSGGDVSIKGLGTFSRSSDADSVVTFKPDESLAKVLNAPFEAFVPVPIPGGVDIQDDNSIDAASQESLDNHDSSQSEQNPVVQSDDNGFADDKQDSNLGTSAVDAEADDDVCPDKDDKTVESSVICQPVSEQSETSDQPVSGHTDSNINDDSAEIDTDSDLSDSNLHTDIDNSDVANDTDDEADDEQAEVYILPRRKCRTLLWGIVGILVGALIGIAIGYYFHDDIDRYVDIRQTPVITKTDGIKPETNDVTQPQKAGQDTCTSDTPNIVQEKTVIEPRYDVVTAHQFLTTLAKKYYGVKDYWVYIYEANKSRLRHPDRIKPGTRIMIPEITEFLADPTPTESNIRQARQLAAQIYGRFK